MKEIIFGGFCFLSGCISIAIVCLGAPIGSILLGPQYEDSSNFFEYLSHYGLNYVISIFILITIIGLIFLIIGLKKEDIKSK